MKITKPIYRQAVKLALEKWQALPDKLEGNSISQLVPRKTSKKFNKFLAKYGLHTITGCSLCAIYNDITDINYTRNLCLRCPIAYRVGACIKNGSAYNNYIEELANKTPIVDTLQAEYNRIKKQMFSEYLYKLGLKFWRNGKLAVLIDWVNRIKYDWLIFSMPNYANSVDREYLGFLRRCSKYRDYDILSWYSVEFDYVAKKRKNKIDRLKSVERMER
jgi:hypothetical protein